MGTGIEVKMDAHVIAAFEAYDTDNSGTIDATKLGGALHDIGLVVDTGQIGYMLRKYDDDRNATLDMLEFGQLVADLRVNSAESIQARLGLRSHPLVTEALEGWWNAAVRSMRLEREELPELPSPPSLDEAQYTIIMKKIFKAMVERWDEEEAATTAGEDWEHDRRGQNNLSGDLFMDGMFELADLWTATVDATDYSRFLWDLLRRIASGTPPNYRCWLPDERIEYGGYTVPVRVST